jgi:HEAT repeat protein
MALIKQSPNAPRTADTRGEVRDLEGLTAQLNGSDATHRRWAARELANFPEASTVLVQRIVLETDASVREMLLASLTRLHDSVAIAGLATCLRSENVALRNEAIEAMAQLPDAVGPIVECLLADADPDVRIFTVNILESLRHPNVESWLIAVIEHDATLNVCATAVDLLVEVGTPAARAPLQRLMARYPDEPYIQFAAELAIKRMIDE